jgi:hypothetical protein
MNCGARIAIVAVCALVLGGTAESFFEEASSAKAMTDAATAFVGSLDDSQRMVAVLPYDTPKRGDWHFIPKNDRKGLQFKDMSESERKLADDLLESALSQIGVGKARSIMRRENLLKELEGGKGANIRDPLRYYYTIFGTPGQERWGLSIEGHHMSLNFVVEGDRVISSTPQVFATNPAVVKNKNNAGIPVGDRPLELEETVAFELVNALSDDQKATAVIAKEALQEVRNAGKPQPPNEPAVGITVEKLNDSQRVLLQKLVNVYCSAMPANVAAERLNEIEKAGWGAVHFAWAGPLQPGIGHYYRIQGPTFLVEFVNTQPDAAGNIANHVHSIWRDMRGDFALPIDGQ